MLKFTIKKELNGYFKNPFVFFFLMFSACLILTGCPSEKPPISLHESDQPVVYFNGYTIPKFPRAIDQLNYARSGFPNKEEKRAAFEFVIRYFPHDRAECGEAILNIAYMNFGFDYRFALIQDYTQAIEEYKTIIKYYADQPSVMAKAYWYIGWIYCDLLNQKADGLAFYWKIIKEYPDTQLGITSPVPWVSLVYPEDDPNSKPKPQKIKTQWAEIALLEIIRNSSDSKEVINAFSLLWENYKNRASTGMALKLLLTTQRYPTDIRPYVHAYLDLYKTNPFLTNELKSLIADDYKESL